MITIKGDKLEHLYEFISVEELIKYEENESYLFLADVTEQREFFVNWEEGFKRWTIKDAVIKKTYLVVWIDCNETFNRWVVLEDISKHIMLKLLKKEIPLIRVYESCKDYIVFDTELSPKKAENIIRVKKEDFPKEYYPSRDYFFYPLWLEYLMKHQL